MHTYQGIPKSARRYTFVGATPEALGYIKLDTIMIETHPVSLGLNSEPKLQFIH